MKLKFWFSSLASIVLGILFLVFQAGVFDIMVKVFAAVLVVLGIIDFITLRWVTGIIKAVLGVAVFLIGWDLVHIALYVVGGLLVLHGILSLVRAIRKKKKKLFLICGIASSLVCVTVGLFLILGQAAIASWIFIVTGIALLVGGVLSFFS